MKNRIITAAVFVAAAAVSSDASIVTVKYTGKGKGQNVRIVHNGNQMDVFAGQLKHQISNATGFNAYLNGVHNTFCADLDEFVSGSNKPFSLVSIDTLLAPRTFAAEKSNAVRSLYATAGAAAIAAAASNDLATAFQIAVWEIITDFNPNVANNNLNITAGNFTARKTNNSALQSGITSLLSTYFTAANTPLASSNQILAISNDGAQDQIVVVPAPGAIVLAGFGGLLAATRKRRA